MRIAVAPSLTFTYTQASPKGALLIPTWASRRRAFWPDAWRLLPRRSACRRSRGGASGAGVATLLGLQGALGNRGVQRYLQRAEAPTAAPAPVGFPYRDRIEAGAGGEVPIPGSAVHDPAACEERGVPAFTDGLVTHFGSPSPRSASPRTRPSTRCSTPD